MMTRSINLSRQLSDCRFVGIQNDVTRRAYTKQTLGSKKVLHNYPRELYSNRSVYKGQSHRILGERYPRSNRFKAHSLRHRQCVATPPSVSRLRVKGHADFSGGLRIAYTPAVTSNTQQTIVAERAIKVDQIALSTLHQSNSTSKPAHPWKANEYLCFAGDVAGVPRSVASLFYTIHGKSLPSGLDALGLTSSLSVLTGYVAGRRAVQEYQKASQVRDQAGRVMGAVNFCRAPVEILGGFTATPLKALSIASMYTSTKTMAAASAVLGPMSSSLFGANYLLLMIPSVMSLGENIRYGRRLHQMMHAPENKTSAQKYAAGLRFLQESLMGTPKDWEETAKHTLQNKRLWDGWHLKQGSITPEDLSLLSAEELTFIEHRVRKEKYSSVQHLNMVCHMQQAFIQMKQRKEIELARQTGTETVSLVKHTGPLLQRLEQGEGVEEAQELFQHIAAERKKNCLLHGAILVLCAMGIASLILGSIASGKALAIVAAALLAATTIGMFTIDGYFLYKAYQSGDLDCRDKALFMVANTLLLGILSAATLFSGGVIPLAISGAVGGTWSALAGYSYYKWNLGRVDSSEEQPPLPHRGQAFVIKKNC